MTEKSRFWDGTTTGDATESPYDAGTEFAEVLMAMAEANRLANIGGVYRGTSGYLAPTISAANTLRVGAGRAFVYGSWYQNDANVDTTIPTPGASTRIDRIVLRKSWVGQTIRIMRIAGVEGGAAPALVQIVGTTWDIPICSVTITTGAVMNVTDNREFLSTGLLTAGDLFNEFMWPNYVPTATSLLTGLWLVQIGTPTVLTYNNDGTGDYKEYVSCTTDAVDEGWAQRYTYTDQKRIRTGKKFSMRVPVWVTTADRTLTVELRTSLGTVVSVAVKPVISTWQTVVLENLTLDGTYVDVRFLLSGVGTFLVGSPSVSCSPVAISLPNRRWKYVDAFAVNLYSADPGGATWFDVDITAQTSPLAAMAQITVNYSNTTTAGSRAFLRRNGDTVAASNSAVATTNTVAALSGYGAKLVALDDGQIFETQTDGAAGNTELLNLSLSGFWEWE